MNVYYEYAMFGEIFQSSSVVLHIPSRSSMWIDESGTLLTDDKVIFL